MSADRRLLAALTLAFPWALLLLLEGALRLGGYGSSYPLFVPHDTQPEYLVPNQEVGRRYFPGGAFTPTPELEFFRAKKAPGTFRIFVQGESSAQGFPYGHGGAPGRMLEQRLQGTFPGREIEVVDVALTAVNSWTLLDQADEIIGQHPDAVLIYTGHNEYYGALGAGSSWSAGRWRPMTKAFLMLRHLRTAQLVAGAMNAAARAARGTGDAEGEPRTVMRLMAGDQRIPLGSPRYERGLAQFRANLGELLARYRARGIPVLIGTVASNERDQPPLASVDGPDPDSAAAYYEMARRLEAAGDSAGARAAYRDARERDALRFRAPEAINRIIREEAARHGAVVVETERALARASPGGVVGRTVMLEHLHPSLDGYFLIADAFYEAMRARRMIGDWTAYVPAARAREEIPVTPLDSLAALLRADRLASGWPFRRRGEERTPAVDTLHPGTRAEELARAVVRGELPWAEATERLRDDAERAGDYALAIRAARALAQEYSWAPQPCDDAARAAMLARRWDEALHWARAAVARRETAQGVQLVGLLLLRAGERDAALAQLRRAAALGPHDRHITVPLQAAEMLPDLEARRARVPHDTIALYELAAAYALTRQNERSREVLAALLRISPEHARARELLERLPP
ncbi:MAG TPA: hypothetical protein VFS05_12395 [Gemmatimonadaceae bacterium]|nr:hypothetical protein [Gemmatimonadaceae bacterium]